MLHSECCTKPVYVPGTGHEILQNNIAWVGSLHLAIYVLQNSSDELDDGNDEAAKSNRPQVVSGTEIHYCHM